MDSSYEVDVQVTADEAMGKLAGLGRADGGACDGGGGPTTLQRHAALNMRLRPEMKSVRFDRARDQSQARIPLDHPPSPK